MSAPKYRYGHGTAKRRPRRALLVVFSTLVVAGVLGGILLLDIRKGASPVVEGNSRVVSQVLGDNAQTLYINEPFFSFELPGDWKETERNRNAQYNSISWQATLKDKSNRYLTLYVDRIPFDLAFNRLVAVRANGTGISYSDVSDNCANFTVGGAQNGQLSQAAQVTPTKWNKVDFLCNLPKAVDNQVGTAAEGSPNAIMVSGPTQGTHKYFFVYTDRNFQPDYSIFYDVLASFRAK